MSSDMYRLECCALQTVLHPPVILPALPAALFDAVCSIHLSFINDCSVRVRKNHATQNIHMSKCLRCQQH